ncbi:hypothetical protein VNI00_001156 [Paramarasmius palmivorus]|uniref:F-box domain-containing protein n=1 Tax=Paramarasmius palmivorus TaxID=297713 RepID=A0AAW0E931_9AGAR
MSTNFESLPVEIIADILGELDLPSIVSVSHSSRHLNAITSDPSLNPWRRPILRALYLDEYHDSLRNLSVRLTVPRQNWVDILTLASPQWILFEATLPNLKASEWEESFYRRFLPGWRKWSHKESSWRMAFLQLENNLAHLETRIRLVVELADVRIIALGTLNRPKSTLTINPNAHVFLHPPGAENYDTATTCATGDHRVADHGVYPLGPDLPDYPGESPAAFDLTKMTHPLPARRHRNYPWYTPGGEDKRWLGSGEIEEDGLKWVGGMMVLAQLVGPRTLETGDGDGFVPLQDLDLVQGPGRHQYTSFLWHDLWAIAPWLEERITRKIDGPGLGN